MGTLALSGCKGGSIMPAADQSAKAVDEIMAADRAFNTMARDKGEQAAFGFYMDPEQGLLIVASQEPAKGHDAIVAIHNDVAVPSPLSWEPVEAFAGKSGDFGSSWGHWRYQGKTADGSPEILTGKYLTVWHKTAAGEWKALMDTGVRDKPTAVSTPAPAPKSNLDSTAPASLSEPAPTEMMAPSEEAPPPTPIEPKPDAAHDNNRN
jgi:ketosteroid isomerase-like protein